MRKSLIWLIKMNTYICLECNRNYQAKELPKDCRCNSCRDKIKRGEMRKSRNVFTGEEMY